jgi:hypothetical protein
MADLITTRTLSICINIVLKNVITNFVCCSHCIIIWKLKKRNPLLKNRDNTDPRKMNFLLCSVKLIVLSNVMSNCFWKMFKKKKSRRSWYLSLIELVRDMFLIYMHTYLLFIFIFRSLCLIFFWPLCVNCSFHLIKTNPMILITFCTHIDGFKTHFMRKTQILGYRKTWR